MSTASSRESQAVLQIKHCRYLSGDLFTTILTFSTGRCCSLPFRRLSGHSLWFRSGIWFEKTKFICKTEMHASFLFFLVWQHSCITCINYEKVSGSYVTRKRVWKCLIKNVREYSVLTHLLWPSVDSVYWAQRSHLAVSSLWFPRWNK